MKIENINTSYTPNFRALPVSLIKSSAGKKPEEIVLYSLSKTEDINFLRKLHDSFSHSGNISIRTLHTLGQNAVKDFINGNDKNCYIAAKGDRPFGLMIYKNYEKINERYLNYIMTWAPDGKNKIKNGGKMLLRQLFENVNTKNITLTNTLDSYIFYIKNGFSPEDDYFISGRLILENSNISKLIEKFNNFMQYKKLRSETQVALDKILVI